MHFGRLRFILCKIRRDGLLPFFCLTFLLYNLSFPSLVKNKEVTDTGMATIQELLESIKHDENISTEIKVSFLHLGDELLFPLKHLLKNETLNDHPPTHFFLLLFLLSDIPPPAFLF